jgi:hypothetical protein
MSQNATTVVVDLSVNEPFCWNLSGFPARVVTGHDDANRFNDKYVMAIRLPGVEVAGLYDALAISELLQTYRLVHRQVILSDAAPALSTMVRSTHALPTTTKHGTSSNSSLGIVFDGFPAKVKSVDSQSPYCNYVPAQQAVHAVIVPGRSTLCLESGGFTGHGVHTHLEKTAHILGRQLILQGQPGAYTETKGGEQLTASKNHSPPPNAPAGGRWGKASSTWMQLLWKGIVCCGQCLGCCCFHTCIVCLAGLGGGGGGGAGSGSLPKCPCEQDEEMDAYMAPNGILYSPNGRVMGDGKSHRFKVTTIIG